jgi:hypothetical protein
MRLPGRIFMGGPWQQVFDAISKISDQLDALQAEVTFIKEHMTKGGPITAKDLSDLQAMAAQARDIDQKES